MSVYLLDKHAPLVKVICRQRGSSDRWYDAECRSTKRKVRRLERLYKNHRSDHSYQKSIDALRGLHRMIDLKRGRYWMEHVKTHRNPAELCRVIDEGMCRTREHSSGRPPGPSTDNLADYFEKKVADIYELPPVTRRLQSFSTFRLTSGYIASPLSRSMGFER